MVAGSGGKRQLVRFHCDIKWGFKAFLATVFDIGVDSAKSRTAVNTDKCAIKCYLN